MSKIKNWIDDFRKNEKVDLNDVQDDILKLSDVDIEMDKLEKGLTDANESIKKKDEEISRLKDKVWELFSRQTTGFEDEEKKKKEESKQKPKSINDFIKYE